MYTCTHTTLSSHKDSIERENLALDMLEIWLFHSYFF